ncbi:MAG TPA: hypothetical protein VF552_09470 [Allosphingosinicella sp.]|jgi:hypothetical protein
MPLLLAAAAAAALAAAAPANAPPQRAGECRWVHGRFAIYNGSGLRRIWVIGTRRIISLWDHDEQVPPAIARYQGDANPDRAPLFGDFYVCALERSRPGHMQHVRLLRTRNLLYRGRPYPSR